MDSGAASSRTLDCSSAAQPLQTGRTEDEAVVISSDTDDEGWCGQRRGTASARAVRGGGSPAIDARKRGRAEAHGAEVLQSSADDGLHDGSKRKRRKPPTNMEIGRGVKEKRGDS